MTSRPLFALISCLMMGLMASGCDRGEASAAEARAKAEARKPIAVTVHFEAPASCGVEMGDARYPLPEAQDALDEALKKLSKTRPVAIHADTKIPYRCMGPVIYYFERAGFERIEGGPKAPVKS